MVQTNSVVQTVTDKALIDKSADLESHLAVDILDMDYILQVVGCYHPQDTVTALDKAVLDKDHCLTKDNQMDSQMTDNWTVMSIHQVEVVDNQVQVEIQDKMMAEMDILMWLDIQAVDNLDNLVENIQDTLEPLEGHRDNQAFLHHCLQKVGEVPHPLDN